MAYSPTVLAELRPKHDDRLVSAISARLRAFQSSVNFKEIAESNYEHRSRTC
jgi:hypothetical protein